MVFSIVCKRDFFQGIPHLWVYLVALVTALFLERRGACRPLLGRRCPTSTVILWGFMFYHFPLPGDRRDGQTVEILAQGSG